MREVKIRKKLWVMFRVWPPELVEHHGGPANCWAELSRIGNQTAWFASFPFFEECRDAFTGEMVFRR